MSFYIWVYENVRMCVCACQWVCVRVRVCVCACVRTRMYPWIRTRLCTWVCVFVCVCVCVFVRACVRCRTQWTVNKVFFSTQKCLTVIGLQDLHIKEFCRFYPLRALSLRYINHTLNDYSLKWYSLIHCNVCVCVCVAGYCLKVSFKVAMLGQEGPITRTIVNIAVFTNAFICTACTDGGVALSGSMGVIKSPGFRSRQEYPNDSRCVWIITAPSGKVCRDTIECILRPPNHAPRSTAIRQERVHLAICIQTTLMWQQTRKPIVYRQKYDNHKRIFLSATRNVVTRVHCVHAHLNSISINTISINMYFIHLLSSKRMNTQFF